MDERVIMPNHIHLLIELGDYGYHNGVTGGSGGGGNANNPIPSRHGCAIPITKHPSMKSNNIENNADG